MNLPPPQCNSCGKVMVEVGKFLQKGVSVVDDKPKRVFKEVTLVQCPSCKDIKLV